MAKAFSPKIVSANHLLSGLAIYRTATGWSGDIADAAIAHDADSADVLLAAAAGEPDIAVGPYLVDVAGHPAANPAPTRFREVLRVTGPTVGVLNARRAPVERRAA
ncbi:MAG: DUF2849 domain-containing protein [Rhodobiaceae bacterium]|nr:DUF2849 domain-containing protein [Rhodobiaceae bacterium]